MPHRTPPREVPQEAAPTAEELATYQRLTLGLVGMALRSLDSVRGEVTLPQLRMLLIVGEAGRSPSARIAEALALSPSAVSHAADKLQAAGYLARVDDPSNRRIVALEITDAGRTLVDSVLAWRRVELTTVLGRLEPGERGAVVSGLNRFAEAMTQTAADHGRSNR